MEETPAIFLSANDRAMLVDRFKKRLNESGLTQMAVIKQLGIGSNQVS